MERSFKGIWIEADIWLCKELKVMEKLFLVEISSLDNKEGCFASNKYFADFFDLSKPRCSQVIKALKDKKLITVSLRRKNNVVVKRIIKRTNLSVKELEKNNEVITEKEGATTATATEGLDRKVKQDSGPTKNISQEIFECYPSHRLSGSFNNFQKICITEEVTENDLYLIKAWLAATQFNSREWQTKAKGKYVLGLIRFIKERYWEQEPIDSNKSFNENNNQRPTSKLFQPKDDVVIPIGIAEHYMKDLKKKFSVK